MTFTVCTNEYESHVAPRIFLGKLERPNCFHFSRDKETLEILQKSRPEMGMDGSLSCYNKNLWYSEVQQRMSADVVTAFDNCHGSDQGLPRPEGAECGIYIFSFGKCHFRLPAWAPVNYCYSLEKARRELLEKLNAISQRRDELREVDKTRKNRNCKPTIRVFRTCTRCNGDC